MNKAISAPVAEQEQSPAFQYMQEHVARSMANFYAAYQSPKAPASSSRTSKSLPRTGNPQSTPKER